MSLRFCSAEREGRLLIVTLDRPEQLNALHKEAHYELAGVFDAFERDPEIWAGILTGSGDRAFCVGADLKSGPLTEDVVPPSGFAGLTHRFDRTKPLIAAVNGLAFGGGFEAALACDLIVASQTASFALTEPRVGLYAAAGGIQRLTREIGPKRANAMLLTGRRVPAEEGLKLGFVNEVVAQADLLAAARRWAAEITACSPTALRAVKAIANSAAYDMAAAIGSMSALPAVRAVSASPDMAEGARALMEKRSPEWNDADDYSLQASG